MAQYTNVGGVARKVAKQYENVGGVAKNVIKAYNNVSGVARQYFASGGVKWKKWNCVVSEESSYDQVDSDGVRTVGDTRTFEGISASSHWFQSHSGWTWDSSDGFHGDYQDYRKVSPGEIVGRYDVVDTELREFISCEDNGDGTYDLTWEWIGLAIEDVWTSYSKGSINYSTVYAEEGEYPEAGTLVKGSPSGNYCVMLVNGTYYYYEKITE